MSKRYVIYNAITGAIRQTGVCRDVDFPAAGGMVQTGEGVIETPTHVLPDQYTVNVTTKALTPVKA